MKKIKIAIIGVIILGVSIIIWAYARNMLSTNSMMQDGFNIPTSTGTMATSSVESTSGNSLSIGRGASKESVDSFSQPASQSIATVDKKIIKNGNLTLKVSKVEDVAAEISEIAKQNEGEVFSSNFYQGSGSSAKTGSITVKVPVTNFEKTFSAIKKVANLVIRESTSGRDVTEEYTDLQAQLKNKQAEEQSFVKILDRAGEIKDVLAVTRELSRVRGEIERLEGRIKLLESQTDMSTIYVSLSEDENITISDSWRPWQTLKNSVNSLLDDIQKFINFVIVLIIRIIPVIILYLLVIFIAYLIGKKIYRRFKKKGDGEK